MSIDLTSLSPKQLGSLIATARKRQAQLTKDILADAGLPVLKTETHIVPVMVGDARLCKAASDMLLEKHNIYIQPINYPTVPKGTERLRITPTPLHTDEMIIELRHALVSVWASLEIPRERPVVVQCAMGGRSSIAASLLKANGFENVINLSGGISDWIKEGLPTAAGKQHAST